MSRIIFVHTSISPQPRRMGQKTLAQVYKTAVDGVRDSLTDMPSSIRHLVPEIIHVYACSTDAETWTWSISKAELERQREQA